MSAAPSAETADRAWPCVHLAVRETDGHASCHRFDSLHLAHGDCIACQDYAAPRK